MNCKKIILLMFVVFMFSCERNKNENVTNTSQNMHEIKKGETIFDVSRQYDISIAEIKSLNPLINKDLSNWQEGIEIIVSSDTVKRKTSR